MAAFDRRFAMARMLARHPRILVTDLEVQLGTRYTFDTLAALGRYYPRTRFVWLMGADNLAQIHRWQHWRGIFANIPIAVFDRPPYRMQPLASPAAASFARSRVNQSHARTLAATRPPAWLFFPTRLEPMSSTRLRQAARSFGPDSLRTRFADPSFRDYNAHANTPAEDSQIEPRMGTENEARQTGISRPPTPRGTGPKPAKTGNGAPGSAVGSNEFSATELRDAIVGSIDDDKGEDIVVVDLDGKSALADYIVIATGRSARQVGAMADHMIETLQPRLSFRISVEGMPQGDWVLIDCGDVVVHLFRPEVRDFYAIEKMWGIEPPLLGAVAGASTARP
jgi:nicotinate-nucleotide adenylyltransferase